MVGGFDEVGVIGGVGVGCVVGLIGVLGKSILDARCCELKFTFDTQS